MALERARILLAATAIATSAGGAYAGQTSMPTGPHLLIAQQNYIDVVGMLEGTGYRVVDMKSTFLGRIRIRAKNREHMREVVVSRSTGEIKSDQIIKVFAAPSDSDARRQNVRNTRSAPRSEQERNNSGLSASIGSSSGSIDSSGAGASVGGASVSADGGGVGIGN